MAYDKINRNEIKRVTPEMYAQISRSMWNVWAQIAPDVMEGYAATGQRLVNSHMVEACLDADRLWLNGDDLQANTWLYAMTARCANGLKRKLAREHKLV